MNPICTPLETGDRIAICFSNLILHDNVLNAAKKLSQ